jgi:hypothetical protein
MNLGALKTTVTDWTKTAPSTVMGERGKAIVRARQFGDVQIRLVEYSSNYRSDHWCSKGHIVFVIAGSLTVEHRDGPSYAIYENMTYTVADEDGAHRVLSEHGATAFIVD